MTVNKEKKKLFLETTAQIGRLSGANEKRQRINKILIRTFKTDDSRNKFITSEIVYCEFLNTVVKDILIIRNLIFNEFLQKKQFILNLSEIDEQIADSNDFDIRIRAQRLFKVTGAIKKRFPKSNEIETKRIITFLNSLARDLGVREFFDIRVNGRRAKIKTPSPNYLTEIYCLNGFPFQECFQLDGNGKFLIEYYENLKNDNGDAIVISNKTVTTKCCKSPIEYCAFEEFFNKKEVSERLKKLIAESKKQKPFSSAFRKKEKNKKWIELIQNSNLDDYLKDFKYRGKECCHYFFDMIIALQCPDDAYILSNDKDFNELGKVIKRLDLVLNFDKAAAVDN